MSEPAKVVNTTSPLTDEFLEAHNQSPEVKHLIEFARSLEIKVHMLRHEVKKAFHEGWEDGRYQRGGWWPSRARKISEGKIY